jgi:hypothetical protein
VEFQFRASQRFDMAKVIARSQRCFLGGDEALRAGDRGMKCLSGAVGTITAAP